MGVVRERKSEKTKESKRKNVTERKKKGEICDQTLCQNDTILQQDYPKQSILLLVTKYTIQTEDKLDGKKIRFISTFQGKKIV